MFRMIFSSMFAACNILVDSSNYIYTLRNYGQRVNCSLLAMNPAKIQILSLTVGISNFEKNKYTETGTFHNVSGTRKRNLIIKIDTILMHYSSTSPLSQEFLSDTNSSIPSHREMLQMCSCLHKCFEAGEFFLLCVDISSEMPNNNNSVIHLIENRSLTNSFFIAVGQHLGIYLVYYAFQ